MSSLLLAAAFFGLGALHGLGPDHLAALATLASKGASPKEALLTAIRFGLGHAGLLAAGALFCFGLGYAIPEGFTRVAELGGGLIVVLLGVAAIIEALGYRVHRHEATGGLHLHLGRRHAHAGTRDGPAAFAVGAALAFSGLRGLLLLLPAAGAGSLLLSIAAFGGGVITSMAGAVYAGTLASRLTASRIASRWARGLVGAISAGVGCAWIVLAF